MKLLRIPAYILLACTGFLFSCSDKTEQFETENIADYLPLQTGKYITYRLDSLVFVNFQQFPETHRYQVKHVVDGTLTDNLGRPTYRIVRYINNETGTGEWALNGTYFITPLEDQVELIEDNLRFIKLHTPMKEGFSWKGNTYLPNEPYASFGYIMENDNDMQTWDFTYDNYASTFTYDGKTYADVYTVESAGDSINVPIVAIQSYGSKTRSVEKYAKNIGLVFRDYALWEYQPNLNGPNPTYSGFAIRMWMIDHN